VCIDTSSPPFKNLKKQIQLISGMAPLIRVVLSNLVGDAAANEIEIIANDVTVFPDGKWEIKFRHPTR
jgi:2-hydroxy-3-keto-5-methylthiopentenyl-1-phosphate phosphatase